MQAFRSTNFRREDGIQKELARLQSELEAARHKYANDASNLRNALKREMQVLNGLRDENAKVEKELNERRKNLTSLQSVSFPTYFLLTTLDKQRSSAKKERGITSTWSRGGKIQEGVILRCDGLM